MYTYSEDYGSLWDVAPRGEGIPIKAEDNEFGSVTIRQDESFAFFIEGGSLKSNVKGRDAFIKKCIQLGVKYIEPSRIAKPRGKAGFVEKGRTHGK